MKKLTFVAIIAILAAFVACDKQSPTGAQNLEEVLTDTDALSKGGSSSHVSGMFEVTLENLAPDGSQPLSPPILATHSSDFHIFRVGQFASSQLEQVAEDAINGPMVELLKSSHSVKDVVEGGGPIPPGGSATFTIEAGPFAGKLSLVTMLVNTNDGFAGLDGGRLPLAEKTYYLRAYDAGTEVNTELESDIPGPCCNSPMQGPDEKHRIKRHEGILGNGDLKPETYGWSEPVVKLTIKRIAPKYKVTVKNLTPDASQPLSPPVIAAHSAHFHMFSKGARASEELEQIAEDAVNGPMLELLGNSNKVTAFTAGDAPIPPGASTDFEIEGFPGSRLSLVTMLVNTNDAFAGLDGGRLPKQGSRKFFLIAYDAGTEKNTELKSDIPGPCCNSPGQGTDEHRRIRPHRGILGIGELDAAIYNWKGPAAEVVVSRID